MNPGRPESYVVIRYGLEGKREHWVPGNHRRGRPAREKRRFASEDEAWAFIGDHAHAQTSRVYQCSICGDWHTASPERQ